MNTLNALIKPVDDFLNHVTMYRLVLYYVFGLLTVAFVMGFAGWAPVEPAQLAMSVVVASAVSYLTNRAFAFVYQIPVNTESIWITAFILALIMPPVASSDLAGLQGIALASFAAIASKFVLAIARRHVFNPVAIGAVAATYLLDQPPTWWVAGNLELMAFVVIGGLLVVRKVQRFEMVSVFILANLAAALATTQAETWLEGLTQAALYSPVFFAGFAMLTEPLTAPQSRKWQLAFAVIVGVLSSPDIHYGDFYVTPELAFLIGNVFAFAVSQKRKFKLTLVAIEKTAAGCYDYVFNSDRKLDHKPGQYIDWTLGMRDTDDRGNRRPFTIASAPDEGVVRLGVKFYPKPSAFKRALLNMKPGDVIYASHTAGEFTLPEDRAEKLAFIAGGIGVTPFRSMVQDMLDQRDMRSVVMLYGNNKVDEIAYTDVFNRAETELGMRTIYAVNQDGLRGTNMHRGFIDAKLITREVPDFHERTFYISGPRAMVTKFQDVLKELGVSRSRIKVDFFPGFA